MKKYFILAALLYAGIAFTSCGKDDDEPFVTPATATVDFEGDYWTALIDNPQFNGSLLYGEKAKDYAWKDETTGLSGGVTPYDAYGYGISYSGGGTAISNYIDNDLENHASYEYQLAVPATNGSKNFAVAYCNSDTQAPAEGTTSIAFAKGVKHVIKSMQIAPTTYGLGTLKNGNGWSAPLPKDGFLTLIITADNGEKIEVNLAKDGELMTSWTTVDLSSLGAVNSLAFTMDGSDKSGNYLNSPTYFAFDNVVVEL